ncbi:hypothetical protein LTR62_004132 [Meristemomyces frigidus]|uniref:BTB domain-containing protein n=1 Tax=Meristemomyces frigidus TaxID=1508187 RepID=A0AAN7YJM3_9PEZI|nr:hypothetical protein LTR62_004132 [Meristemomyces frigidus]
MSLESVARGDAFVLETTAVAQGDRSPKKRKSSTLMSPTAGVLTPADNMVHIARSIDGNRTILVKRLARSSPHGGIGLIVCDAVIRDGAPHLALIFENPMNDMFQMPDDDDGDAVYLLMCLLHLRHNLLPTRLAAESLCELARLATKYQCGAAIGSMTVRWFDRLFTNSEPGTGKLVVDDWEMIQAAYLLDEPPYFRRFSDRFVLSSSQQQNRKVTSFADIAAATDQALSTLASQLQARRATQLASVRADLDLLIESCSAAFAKGAKHYIDYAPGMDPDKRGIATCCRVDEGAATLFLGALRDERIWPLTVWQGSLADTLKRIMDFRVPEYDDADKCEFCEDVKMRFTAAMCMVKQMHRERLWGVCLDCFKAGGANTGECCVEHPKMGVRAK